MTNEKKEPCIAHCWTCSHEWPIAYLPLPVETVVKLFKSPCPMCGGRKIFNGPIVKSTSEGDPLAWVSNGDTGTSSMTIWRVMMGQKAVKAWDNDVPYDPDDFGRCYRLLKVIPSWRARLSEVAAQFPKWQPLVTAWDELTALYEEELPNGTAPKLYSRMQELLQRRRSDRVSSK